MKPWEETWTAVESEPPCLSVEGERMADFAEFDRAQLAAQAPRMAQLLLRGALKQGTPPSVTEIVDVLRAAGVIP